MVYLNKEYVLNMVKKNGTSLKQADDTLKQDKEVC